MNRIVASSETYPFVVFRHPSPDDPIVMYHVVSRALRRARRGIADGGYPVFLYGRDVPIWGGPAVAWALPRGGAISVFHDAINRESMAEVYRAIRIQTNPMVLAPEGQITYRNYLCAPIQRGVAALAVDAADTRAATSAGSDSSVVVLPVSLEYRYPDPGWHRAAAVMDRILRRLGIGRDLRPRRRALATALAEQPVAWLTAAWEEYADAMLAIHRREAPRLVHDRDETDPVPDGSGLGRLCKATRHPTEDSSAHDSDQPPWTALQKKIDLLLELSLRRAEVGFHLQPLSKPLDRLFRVRQRYWERLYPLDRGIPGSLTRAVSDAAATEALLVSRHMQSADVLVYVDFMYLQPIESGSLIPGSANHARFVEYLLMLDDLLQRSVGYTVGERSAWRGRRCTVRIGDAMPIDRASENGPSRRSRARDLHGRIERALADLSGRDFDRSDINRSGT